MKINLNDEEFELIRVALLSRYCVYNRDSGEFDWDNYSALELFEKLFGKL